MIRASAGSGKTWQLANRFLALVVLGVKPERIVALTFTRKAAGEFADRILTMLADGASSPAGAEVLSEQLTATIQGRSGMQALVTGDIELPSMNQDFFQHKLKEMTGALDKLTLSTLDSFFVKIVRYFTFELGLAGFELVQGAELEREKLSVLTEMFSSQGPLNKSYQNFLEAFKLATMGSEETRLTDTLQEFVREFHQLWLKNPHVDKWGNPQALWGDKRPWRTCSDKRKKVARVIDLLESEKWHKSLVKSLVKSVEWLGDHEKGAPLEGMPTGVSRLIDGIDAIRAGEWIIEYSNKEYVAQGELLVLLDELLTDFICGELELKMERTRGVFEVINSYERLYQSRVRGQGKLGFSDIGLLLSGHDSTGLWDEVARELVDFRMDGRFDHWMLDEFQDTSRIQWAVIRNLVDEIMFSQEGDRSLFVVGDTKQGIYGWRGGDSQLFNDLLARYGDQLSQSPMDQSWRSTPEVLDLLNTVCDPDGEAMQELFDSETLSRWEYEQHSSAKSGAGHAWVCEVEASEELSGSELQHAWVGELLEKIDPVGRQLSCAVIVRKNADSVALGEHLRQHHSSVPVALDSEITVAEDNPVTCAVADAFRYLLYPNDTLALNHLKMSPMAEVLGFDELTDAAVWYEWSRKLADTDIPQVLRDWVKSLKEQMRLSAYSIGRLHELERAAALFSESNGDIEDWVSELEEWKQKEVSREGVVQIMTVHKSKGLGFDVVILPGMDSSAFDSVGKLGLIEKKDNIGEADHYMLFPQKIIASADPEIRSQMEQWQRDQSYEAFCVLYVALSRAKSGVYCLLPEAKKSSSPVKRNTDWIRLATGSDELRSEKLGSLAGKVLYESGDWNWLDSREVIEGDALIDSTVTLVEVTGKASSMIASERGDSQYAQRLMNRKGLQLGTEVHEIFERIEWVDESIDGLAGSKHARELVLKCFENPDVRSLFSRKENTTVYREVSVETIINNEWVSGVIDRMHVVTNAENEPVSAEIIDFKTDASDQLADLGDKYARQLELYQLAVAKILSVPNESIKKTIVSTHHKSLLRLD